MENAKKLIMNIDNKFDDNIKFLEDKLGIKRNAIVRLAVCQYRENLKNGINQ
jgi:hypothetical protein